MIGDFVGTNISSSSSPWYWKIFVNEATSVLFLHDGWIHNTKEQFPIPKSPSLSLLTCKFSPLQPWVIINENLWKFLLVSKVFVEIFVQGCIVDFNLNHLRSWVIIYQHAKGCGTLWDLFFNFFKKILKLKKIHFSLSISSWYVLCTNFQVCIV